VLLLLDEGRMGTGMVKLRLKGRRGGLAGLRCWI
jgi:peptidyl-tRNA hydrolase